MIDKIDHIVLNVSSIEKAKIFYEQILGLSVVEFAKERFAITLGNQKINLHTVNTEAIPKAKNPSLGSFDICFTTSWSLSKVKERLEKHHIDIIEYDVERTGASGMLKSLYIYDFDGNLIEISNEIFSAN